ncbi:MAG TPA: HAT repeat-containing protein, partial [Solirubrobacteraceae bacterium]|nr:HAT repeat-containing protein [Solirubrobacteraceae bacterium]
LSVEPLNERAAVESAAGNVPAARRALEQAVRRQPSDPETWLRLAEFELTTANRPVAARRAVGAALHLDPRSPAGQALFLEALRRSGQQAAPGSLQPQQTVPPAAPGGDPGEGGASAQPQEPAP